MTRQKRYAAARRWGWTCLVFATVFARAVQTHTGGPVLSGVVLAGVASGVLSLAYVVVGWTRRDTPPMPAGPATLTKNFEG